MMNSQIPQQIKIVVVGDGAVGKTCILLTYTQDKFPTEYVPTVFENFSGQVVVDGKQLTLSLWDTAGQESYSHLRALSYSAADAFIVVFSVLSKTSFDNVWTKWLPELEEQALQNIPKIIAGNKADQQGEVEGAEQVCHSKGYQYIECSALTQMNIKDLIDVAVRAALKKNTITQSQVVNSNKSHKRLCQLI